MADPLASHPRLDAVLDSFAHELVVAIVNLELHAPASEHVQSNLNGLHSDLAAIRVLRGGRTDLGVRVTFDEDALRIDGIPQLGASLQAGKLLRLAHARGIVEVEFGAAVSVEELLRFLVLLTSPRKLDAFTPATIERALHSHGIRHVTVTLAQPGVAPRRDESGANSARPALRGYQELADCLQDSHVAASRGESIELDRANGVVEAALHEMDREPSGLLELAFYDDIDSFTVGHSVRVALLTLQVARAAGADEAALLKAGTAALLHDIGKSRIPQSVLFKQGPLDEEEWTIMGMHPRLGAEILIEQPEIDPTAIGAAFCHHMAPGARGYPRPALPFEPSNISKLVRVVDVFEALTSVRPYKPALTPTEAYVIMHRTPGDFDADWLRFFVDSIGLYPLGTRLTMSTGEHAIVIGHGQRRDQPRVRIECDREGKVPVADAPSIVTVGECTDGVCRRIIEVVSRRPRSAAAQIAEAGEHVHGEHVHGDDAHRPCC